MPSPAFTEITFETQGCVGVVTLNRPAALNAWTPTMEREVRDALRGAARDDNVRAIVLTGAGRGFCAGGDMGGLRKLSSGAGRRAGVTEPMEDFGLDMPSEFHQRYSYFPSVPKPIIAAVNGPCAGLGFVLTSFCDIRFASADAFFVTTFARRGLVAEYGISWLLPRLVGTADALDLLFASRRVTAEEALRMRFINRVCAPDDLLPAAMKYARELTDTASPRSLRIIKRQVWTGLLGQFATALAEAEKEMEKCMESEDFKEGVAHFVERRPPRFSGR